ncbi:hypothetical protein AOB57_001220 [Methanosarcina flavescens]|uniref:Uncharacterized protein n=1 Tax=Methanosarcina flavescens TaxID=1715806 RepID=A0A660HPF7_9EURY|nr:hypothetical protein AOB57_001220 [Methanosarcina flavescens]
MLVRVLIVKKILEKYLIKNLFVEIISYQEPNLFVEIVFIWSLLPCCLFKIKPYNRIFLLL